MSERFALIAEELTSKKASLGGDADDLGNGGSEIVEPVAMKKWLQQQIQYLQTTSDELMD